MARFGPKQGKDSENLVVLFEQEFLAMPSPPPTPRPPQQCIGLQNYKVYNTLCPANSFYANLGRTIKISNLK